jgi:hypothetical protein
MQEVTMSSSQVAFKLTRERITVYLVALVIGEAILSMPRTRAAKVAKVVWTRRPR